MSNKKQIIIGVAIALTFFTGCLVDVENNNSVITKSTKSLLVFETDFTTGQISSIDSSNKYTKIATVKSDASVYSYNNNVYVLEAYGTDNIVKYSSGSLVYQEHLRDNANPKDINFVSDTKAFISCQNMNFIYIINPTTGLITDSINIKNYATSDSTKPYSDKMALTNGYLYVSLQRRNGYSPDGNTQVLKINAQTNAIDTIYNCTYKNSATMILANNELYLANTGSFSDATDGAIEKINLATGAVSVLIKESDIGDWQLPSIFAKNSSEIFVKFNKYDSKWNEVAMMVVLNGTTGTAIDTLTNLTLPAAAIYDETTKRLFVAERSIGASGIVVFENGIFKEKINTDLPPNGFTFLEE